MADADDVRRLALALPHVAEIDSDGFDLPTVRSFGNSVRWLAQPPEHPQK